MKLKKKKSIFRYTWKIYSERLLTLAGVYGFWKHVSKLERRETRRYLEMFYILKYQDLASTLIPSAYTSWQIKWSKSTFMHENIYKLKLLLQYSSHPLWFVSCNITCTCMYFLYVPGEVSSLGCWRSAVRWRSSPLFCYPPFRDSQTISIHILAWSLIFCSGFSF